MHQLLNATTVARRRVVDVAAATLLLVTLLGVYRFDVSTPSLAPTNAPRSLMHPGSETAENRSEELAGAGLLPDSRSDRANEAATTRIDRDLPTEEPTPTLDASDSETLFEIAGNERPIEPEIIATRPHDPIQLPARRRMLEQVEFFKTPAAAKSVAFVVDCSGSMQGEKFQRAQAELARSVINLRRGQSFYVVFFNEGFVPMFGERSPAMEAALPDVKTRVIEWLNRVRSSGGTNPEPALTIAAKLEPDVIYLLTDGQFNSLRPRTLDSLTARRIIVHTIGFGADSDTANLQAIAARTGGIYRAVAVSDVGASTMYLASPEE